MTDKRITDLPAAEALLGNEVVVLVQGGETRRASAGQIAGLSGGSGGGSDVPLSNDTPIMDQGVGAPGTGTEAARWNHVHPTDTSRASAQALASVEQRVLSLEQNGGAAVDLSEIRTRLTEAEIDIQKVADTAAATERAVVDVMDRQQRNDDTIAQISETAQEALAAATALPQRRMRIIGDDENPYITTASDAGQVLLWTGQGQLIVSLSQLTPGTEIEMIAAAENSIRIDPGSGSNLISAKDPITIGRGSRARALRISMQTWAVDGDLQPRDTQPGMTYRFASEDGNTFVAENGLDYYVQETL